MKNLTAVLASILFSTLAFISEARAAAIPVLGWGYSIGYGVDCGIGAIPCGSSPLGNDNWSIFWDPPVSALTGRATFEYDPNLITVRPERSGFLGQFSDNPAIEVPFDASEVYPAFDMSTISGPRPGMVYDLFVGPHTVILTFDVSANPVTVSDDAGPINFFALAITTKVPVSGFTIGDANIGDFHEVGNVGDQSQTFLHCSDALRGTYNCGETNSPSRGFGLTAAFVPEPSSLTLLSTGMILAVRSYRWQRRK